MVQLVLASPRDDLERADVGSVGAAAVAFGGGVDAAEVGRVGAVEDEDGARVRGGPDGVGGVEGGAESEVLVDFDFDGKDDDVGGRGDKVKAEEEEAADLRVRALVVRRGSQQ